MRVIKLWGALALLAMSSHAVAQNAIVKYLDAQGRPINVTAATPLPTSAAAAAADPSQANPGSDATKAVAVQGVTGGKAVAVSAASLPLPSGAATAANQSTGNATLSTISAQIGTPLQAGGSVTANQVNASSTDFSGTVTLGGTYQTALAASGTRKGCLIQNPSTATEVLSIKVGTMASPFTLPAGSTFSCAAGQLVVTDAITVTAATTAHAFVGISQ